MPTIGSGITVGSGVNISYGVVRDGLVLELDATSPASNPGSGTTWFDVSGYGNNATLQNGAYFNSINVVFDGADDGVDLNRSYFQSPDAFSAEVWFKPDGIKGGAQMLVYEGRGDGFGGNDEWHINYSGTNPYVQVYMQGTSSININSGLDTIDVTKYTQACWTVTGLNSTATGTLYINGTSVASASGVITRAGYIENALVGRPWSLTFPAVPRTFAGVISDVMIYNRQLSAEEVAQNFTALRTRYGI